MRDDLVSSPGSADYRAATTPHNATVVQQPAMVACAANAEDVADAVGWAARHDLRVAVQASGHGAGAPIGAEHLLLDTSRLASVQIDGRVARVGAGATWSAVNAVAERDGLLGLAGSSPTVAVAGYTFGGGVGYLTRPHGMASSALLAVDYVDGNGQTRRATEDADDVVDREALWAFRGGGGVGVATTLTVELVEPQDLWAGYQLWGIDALDAVAEAWAKAMAQIGDALTTSLSVLHTPPGAPAFPSALQGVPVVHLSFASPQGADAGRPLLDALRTAPQPAVDSNWAPADAARLAQIHLDPPNPVAALGAGRWLRQGGIGLAGDLLRVAANADSPLAMVELRNLDNDAPTRDGAMTAVPGPLLLHAVGNAADPGSHGRVEDGLARLVDVAGPADTGRSSAPFADGRAADAGGLTPGDLTRLAAAAAAVDPVRRLEPSRILASVGRR
ncbi:FAD-binding oxidoreductase [Mycolicibacterium sp. P1-18]|uniref:FAD-binding oxidoreductase n=1 Tax=Mycolicibacterium sp. P1-18 TaxID=2024615 RepID=UPI0011F21EB8|nr:FAD-dependent oxidoreductase [Mycolicibacterium sp. P1-18]KAA0099546.1 FAD-binding oxidoreductase [Mycolicibacterium sp. P1-18]